MTKEVAILGKGPSHTDYMLNNIRCETWASQSTYDALSLRARINKTFRLHPHEIDKEPNKYGLTLSFQFIPINRLREVFGDMFHSSIAWMVGTAIVTGYNAIHLIGVDFLNNVERGPQRDGLFRLIGMGETMGIQFIISNRSAMYLHSQLYGLQDFVVKLDNKLLTGDKK